MSQYQVLLWLMLLLSPSSNVCIFQQRTDNMWCICLTLYILVSNIHFWNHKIFILFKRFRYYLASQAHACKLSWHIIEVLYSHPLSQWSPNFFWQCTPTNKTFLSILLQCTYIYKTYKSTTSLTYYVHTQN